MWDGMADDPITAAEARVVAADWRDTTQLSNALDAAAGMIERLTDEFPAGFVWSEAEGRPVFRGDLAADKEIVRDALKAAYNIAECGDHQDHLIDAERKARAAWLAFGRISTGRAVGDEGDGRGGGVGHDDARGGGVGSDRAGVDE